MTGDKKREAPRPSWPRYPTLYEINTWVWLFELSQKYGETLTLSGIPAVEWDAIAAYRFDAVWLMGVWERSPAGIAIAILFWALTTTSITTQPPTLRLLEMFSPAGEIHIFRPGQTSCS
jgi:hypothetical protein